ncbi:MAG: tetratricopeptide repeat protein [Bacteriovorax sp.]
MTLLLGLNLSEEVELTDELNAHLTSYISTSSVDKANKDKLERGKNRLAEIRSTFTGDLNNYVDVLDKGTRGRITEYKKLPSGNYGVKLKLTNGVYEGETFWVYYNAKRPRLSILNKDNQDVGQEGLVNGNRALLQEKHKAYLDFENRNLEASVGTVLPMMSKGRVDENLAQVQKGDCNKIVSYTNVGNQMYKNGRPIRPTQNKGPQQNDGQERDPEVMEDPKTVSYTMANGVIYKNGRPMKFNSRDELEPQEQGRNNSSESGSEAQVQQNAYAQQVVSTPAPVVIPKKIPTPAVKALMDEAHQLEAAEKYEQGIATLERALRIDGKQPEVYLELSRLTMKSGKAAQAEQLALKGLASSAPDNDTKRGLWLTIALSRASQGNTQGELEAQEKAAAIPLN